MKSTNNAKAHRRIRLANHHKRPRLLDFLDSPTAEVNIGGVGVAGDLTRIYEVRHQLAKRDGRDSMDWRNLVAVLNARKHGPSIRLVTAKDGRATIFAVLDGESFEVLAELGPE